MKEENPHEEIFSDTIIAAFDKQCELDPNRTAFCFIENNGEKNSLSYEQLRMLALKTAHSLARKRVVDKPILLFFEPGLDYIQAIFGCIYSRNIAVPVYLSLQQKTTEFLSTIIEKIKPALILSNQNTYQRFVAKNHVFVKKLNWELIDKPNENVTHFLDFAFLPLISPSTTAFLMFSSGSTAQPKGIPISHKNFIANLSVIKFNVMPYNDPKIALFWLPPFHDMGLMGSILVPACSGVTTILLSPYSFIRAPFDWLRLISEYRAQTSGCPNFALSYCLEKITTEQKQQLDLSCLEVLFIGSDPIQWDTLQLYYKEFKNTGLRWETFFPCYGMAEATVFVSGGPRNQPPHYKIINEKRHVSCGKVADNIEICVVENQQLKKLSDNMIGEIWIKGESISQGYWKSDNQDAFQAYLSSGEGPYFATGDLGFCCNKELYITGRIKDVFILNGKNIFYQDIENDIEISAAEFVSNGCFVFNASDDQDLIVVQEVKNGVENFSFLMDLIKKILSRNYGLTAYNIIFVKKNSLPKTTSGKKQRYICKTYYFSAKLHITFPKSLIGENK